MIICKLRNIEKSQLKVCPELCIVSTKYFRSCRFLVSSFCSCNFPPLHSSLLSFSGIEHVTWLISPFFSECLLPITPITHGTVSLQIHLLIRSREIYSEVALFITADVLQLGNGILFFSLKKYYSLYFIISYT